LNRDRQWPRQVPGRSSRDSALHGERNFVKSRRLQSLSGLSSARTFATRFWDNTHLHPRFKSDTDLGGHSSYQVEDQGRSIAVLICVARLVARWRLCVHPGCLPPPPSLLRHGLVLLVSDLLPGAKISAGSLAPGSESGARLSTRVDV